MFDLGDKRLDHEVPCRSKAGVDKLAVEEEASWATSFQCIFRGPTQVGLPFGTQIGSCATACMSQGDIDLFVEHHIWAIFECSSLPGIYVNGCDQGVSSNAGSPRWTHPDH